jgi:hypothetical protein
VNKKVIHDFYQFRAEFVAEFGFSEKPEKYFKVEEPGFPFDKK